MKDPDRFSSFPSLADLDGRPKPSIRVSEIISALSYALDLTEGQPMGHSVRACIIGMRLAEQIGLPASERGDLYYALLSERRRMQQQFLPAVSHRDSGRD